MAPIPPWVFGLKRVWVMGYQGIMGYGVDFPLSRLGKAIILWVIRVYGLPEVWVKRVSTVGEISTDFTSLLLNSVSQGGVSDQWGWTVTVLRA